MDMLWAVGGVTSYVYLSENCCTNNVWYKVNSIKCLFVAMNKLLSLFSCRTWYLRNWIADWWVDYIYLRQRSPTMCT